MRSTEDLIVQLDDQTHRPGASFEHPLHELLGLDKEPRSIRGSLKLETMKKVQLEDHIEREKCKLTEIENNPEYNNSIREDIRNGTERLYEDLGQESMNLLKGGLTIQFLGIKETIAKVLDRDSSLAEKIRMLFREQGNMITSILMAIGMTIGILGEALLPSGGGAAA